MKRETIVSALCALCAAGAFGASASAEKNAIQLTWHRGLHDRLPENTAEAIRAAFDGGAQTVEVDFNEEPDGTMLCYHDPKRRALVKPPYRVPTIDEVFATVPKDGRLQCEIKQYGSNWARIFSEAARRHGLEPKNLDVSSFNRAALRDFHRREPSFRTIWLFGGARDLPAGTNLVERILAAARETGVWSVCPGAKAAVDLGLEPKDADAIRAAGFDFRLYGVNSEAALRTAAALGATAFTCDHPFAMRHWARRAGIALKPMCAGMRRSDNPFAALFPPDVKTVGIVSTSSILDDKKLARGLACLRKAGYRVKVASNVSAPKQASPETRAREFEKMWLDPEVDILWPSRGGEGAFDMVALVDWPRLRQRDMRLVGFSDLTVVTQTMLREGAGHPYTGHMLGSIQYATAETIERFRDTLAGRPLAPVTVRGVKPAPAQGLPAGGHLERVARLCQADKLPSYRGRVVFLECTARYSLDEVKRCLNLLRDKGALSDAAAVVLADFQTLEAAALDDFTAAWAQSLSCPVFADFPYGHTPRSFLVDLRRPVRITSAPKGGWQAHL